MHSEDRVVEMTRPLNRLYHVEVESQVREERQNRNNDFPITFVGNNNNNNNNNNNDSNAESTKWLFACTLKAI